MAEVLRVILGRTELEPVRRETDPVVLRGITLVPRHGAQVRVRAKSDAPARAEPALAAQPG
jgi:hypothetical protein